jgi:hypothetical protein
MHVSRSQVLRATIVDAVGRVVSNTKLQAQPGDNNFTLNVMALSSGTYMLKVTDEDESISTQKFVVR